MSKSKPNGRNLFDQSYEERRREFADWRPPTPPDLTRHKEIRLDPETTGLEWGWGKRDKPVGLAIMTPADGKQYYLPFGHKGGGNLDEAVVKRWADEQLRGKRITNLNIKGDLHSLREWGVDLCKPSRNNEFSDVSHYAALLEDDRRRFNLNELCEDFLPDRKQKADLELLHKGNLAELPAGEVAPYAMMDVELVDDLATALYPRLEAEDLHRVRALEDAVIPAVVWMEWQGAPLDMPLLERWAAEAASLQSQAMMRLRTLTPGKSINPNSFPQMSSLFASLGLEVPRDPLFDKPSFAYDLVKDIDDEVIRTAVEVRKWKSLRSKYYDKYLEAQRYGLLRYALHQCRFVSDEGKGGTVSGRFSSAGLADDYGVNIQQVMAIEKQARKYGDDAFFIRQLFVPALGQWLSADAKQIEYRLLAHYANDPAMLAVYAANVEADYHDEAAIIFHRVRPDLGRKQVKNCNFMKVYGGGVKKLASMLGVPLSVAYQINRAYERAFPYIRPLIELAMSTAESRGYVHTLLGRRSRFKNGHRIHKALNAIIQGTAADIMKMYLVEVYRNMKTLDFNLRATVHDELDGDVYSVAGASRMRDLLNDQSVMHQWGISTKVPILWDVQTGANWAEPDLKKLKRAA